VKRALKLLLVCTMLALIPLRGLAAVTVGICATGEQEGWMQGHADHDHDAGSNTHGDDSKHHCDACAEHCTGASFVAQAASVSLAPMPRAQLIVHGDRFAAGHVPDHLDPPPLAL
jgi:hypothetical protein